MEYNRWNIIDGIFMRYPMKQARSCQTANHHLARDGSYVICQNNIPKHRKALGMMVMSNGISKEKSCISRLQSSMMFYAFFQRAQLFRNTLPNGTTVFYQTRSDFAKMPPCPKKLTEHSECISLSSQKWGYTHNQS